MRRALAALLEQGRLRSFPPARVASAWWAEVARVARPLRIPSGARVVAVGGATLGGSGKTPFALACARALAARGHAAVLVGHGYKARPGRPRVVMPDDDVRVVGDEALMCARALSGHAGPEPRSSARVVVAPTRQAAIDHAAELGAALVLDGVGQVEPTRARRAFLVVDAYAPWGSGLSTPAGDLRASPAALLAACDAVVRIVDPMLAPPPPMAYPVGSSSRPTYDVEILSRGVWIGETLYAWSELSRQRVGLVTALARPARLLAMLSARGIVPEVHVAMPDHMGAVPRPLGTSPVATSHRATSVDVWIASPKCATHLPTRLGGALVAMIDHKLTLPPRLVDELDYVAAPHL